jgi:hypothetical protein
VLLLKGAALARTVYEQIGLRPMLDTDILVRSHDLEQTRSILTERGFQELPCERHVAYDHHHRFSLATRFGSTVHLEVHWRLSDNEALADRLPLEGLWARSVAAPSPYQCARVLDTCDSLLHAALHIVEHGGLPQLRWLCDVDLLARSLDRQPRGWNTLAERALSCELQLIVAAVLEETVRLFGTSVPGQFWDMLRAGLPAADAARRAYALCSKTDLVGFELRELRALRTVRDKWRHAWSLVFPPRSVIQRRHRLPRSAWLAPYYMMRLGRGVGTLITRAFR